MNYDLIWSKFLEKIKFEVNSVVYATWFGSAKLYKIENNIATIVVPMDIHRRHLNDYYYKMICNILYQITNQMYELNFILKDEISSESTNTLNDEIISNVKDNEEKRNYVHYSNLIKSYNFENFVVGNSNKLAHATALAVAENPGETYNPLFIYGSSGLGKTHLMHAIGNYIEEKSNKRVLYISSQQFIDDFVKLGRDKTNYEYAEYFKNKYRTLDVLIIDDIQFF